jgi:hypothetical protein
MLRDGQGEVRCGACRSVFNALDYLSDDVPGDGYATGPSLAEVESDATPKSAVPAATAPAPSIVPDALRADLAAAQDASSPRGRHTGLWVAALVLLLGLAFQYLWFAPADLSARFPMARSTVERFCLEAGCMQSARRDPEQIRMLSRDVRAHPRYEGALLVTATFSNAAPRAQPFPRLRFSLYDVNGQTIAARTFTPAEYLAGALPADSVLPPGQPVQIALELLAPEQAAVSFEFTFI